MKNETNDYTATTVAQNNTSRDSSAAGESAANAQSSASAQIRFTDFLENTLATLGYELVSIEIINQRLKVLRVFIDVLNKKTGAEGVGIEDCVTVTRALDEPLEANADIVAIFNGPYELEVSSPGIERPLRKPQDYNRFAAEIARIHTFRPLTASETQAEIYSKKNPKQKNFYGIIRGLEQQSEIASVLLGVIPEDGTQKKIETALPLKNETLIRIPLTLISKANLEPAVDWQGE